MARQELTALRSLIGEAHLILSTTELPEGRAVRSLELLASAMVLADDLIAQAKPSPAAALGRKGGTVTAKRGSDYFRELAAKRKTLGGGRPRKSQ